LATATQALTPEVAVDLTTVLSALQSRTWPRPATSRSALG